MKINENIMIGNTNKTLGNIASCIKIVDVTQSQSGRYITSKIPFNTDGVLFWIFQAAGAWSNHVMQVAFFNSSTENICILGNWENNVVFSYNTIFKLVNGNQIRVEKYAQGANMINENFTIASDSDWGAIRPNKIYVVTTRSDIN